MKIISFEGIDGSGKSTQFKLQKDRLGKDYSIFSYEYSSKENFWGRKIKEIYSENSKNPLKCLKKCRSVQEFLYGLSAKSNMKNISLDKQILLTDRSIVTAYASHIGRLPEWFVSLCEPNLIPDLVVYLDIPPELGLERLKTRSVKFLDESLEEQKPFMNLIEE